MYVWGTYIHTQTYIVWIFWNPFSVHETSDSLEGERERLYFVSVYQWPFRCGVTIESYCLTILRSVPAYDHRCSLILLLSCGDALIHVRWRRLLCPLCCRIEVCLYLDASHRSALKQFAGGNLYVEERHSFKLTNVVAISFWNHFPPKLFVWLGGMFVDVCDWISVSSHGVSVPVNQ